MKAIRVHRNGGPEVLQLEETPELHPDAGQVVVQVKAAGVNPVDTYIRAGGVYSSHLPYTPGMDAAGIVTETGRGVTRLSPGDRVYVARSISGTYAEYTLCLEKQVQELPENVSFEEGAGVFVPFATAYRALFQRAHAKPSETVLIHGASGGVGTAAVQFAASAGLKIIGTAGTAEGCELVLQQGAQHALNHHDSDYLQEVMEITENQGVDIVLEMLANVNLAKDLGVIARNGRIVVIGSRGKIEIDPRAIMSRNAMITGIMLLTIDDPDLNEAYAAIYAGLANGTLKPIVGQTLPLAEAAKAHELVLKPGAHGKIILLP
jgi:NADPH2:quinone reductase